MTLIYKKSSDYELKSLGCYFIVSVNDKMFSPLTIPVVDSTFDFSVQPAFVYRIGVEVVHGVRACVFL